MSTVIYKYAFKSLQEIEHSIINIWWRADCDLSADLRAGARGNRWAQRPLRSPAPCARASNGRAAATAGSAEATPGSPAATASEAGDQPVFCEAGHWKDGLHTENGHWEAGHWKDHLHSENGHWEAGHWKGDLHSENGELSNQ